MSCTASNRARLPWLRGWRWLVAIAITSQVLGAPKFTPPPTPESIPPQPAAPDSYEARLVGRMAPYLPQVQVSGVIRLWGHGNAKLPWMRFLVTLWEQGFRKFQPGVHFDYQMHGTSSGVPSLFAGVGDIAILGEEILPEEVAAFAKVKHYPPLSVDILTGSVDVRNFDYAQQFFVHARNPLTHLTVTQLAAVFGTQRGSQPANIRTWGQLGLAGVWADRAITPYGWALDDSFATYLEQSLLGGGHAWNCALREFAHRYQSDGSVYDHGQQILDALARDRYGIAVSNIRYAGPDVKALAIGQQPGGPFYQATKENLVEHRYPFARRIPAVIDRAPGRAVDPKLREFLRYLLSRDGQSAVIEDGRYLPLAPDLIAAELRKID